jgi:hypothetical protein
MGVKAYERRDYPIVGEKLTGSPRILSCDERHGSEDANGAVGNVLKVTDRGRNYV